MQIGITDDNKFLILRNMNNFELDSVRTFFTKEPENAWVIKKKNPYFRTETEFINHFGMMPIGLWTELIRYSQQKNVLLEFDPKINEVIQDTGLSFETFKYYSDSLFANAYTDKGEKASPREYQLEGVFKLLKFKKACVEVTTSGGKTLMAYLLYKFLRDIKHSRKCLYIVPNKNLATQSYDKFIRYEEWVKGSGDYKLAYLHGELKKKEKEMVPVANILFATYQSLSNIKDNGFFEEFDTVIVDECHHGQSASVRKILKRCKNTQYVFGMTGTFPKEDSFDRFVIESYIGPLVYTLTAFELINVYKSATPIHVVNTYLNYASEEERKVLYDCRAIKDKEDTGAGMKLLKQEIQFVNKNYNRKKYICDLASKTKLNTLILFNDVNDSQGYGKEIFEYLKKYTDKDVFYADGHTDSDTRDYYNKKMDEDLDGNTVIVGSQGTYSEGIDIANIGVIILAESFKSENILRQSIGRGMRLGEKDKVVMFDIVDDLRYDKAEKDWLKDNYLWKQHKERTKAYKEHKFPVYEQKIDFNKIENLI